MMNQQTNPTFKEKYLFVDKNRNILQYIDPKIFAQLSYFQQIEQPWKEPAITSSESFSKVVKLQTLSKCCMPAYYSLHWEDQINYKNTVPLTAIVAFPYQGQQYYSIDQKFATWIESGGTKVTPLKASVSKQKLEFYMKNVDAIVIPEVKEKQKNQDFFEMLAQLLTVFKELPILAVGNSALLLISYRNKSPEMKQKIKYQIKGFNPSDLMIFATHSDPYFSNLNLKTRLEIQNKPKIASTLGSLPLQNFTKIQNFKQFTHLAIGKYQDLWQVVLVKDELVHYCFVDSKMEGSNMDSITFCHKMIVNFTEQIRKRNKNKSQIQLELGHYKMIYKDEKYHYNCDLKLPKV